MESNNPLKDIDFVGTKENNYSYISQEEPPRFLCSGDIIVKQKCRPTNEELDSLSQHAQLNYERRAQDDTYANDGGSWLGCW